MFFLHSPSPPPPSPFKKGEKRKKKKEKRKRKKYVDQEMIESDNGFHIRAIANANQFPVFLTVTFCGYDACLAIFSPINLCVQNKMCMELPY
jgi:hypothetical protein